MNELKWKGIMDGSCFLLVDLHKSFMESSHKSNLSYKRFIWITPLTTIATSELENVLSQSISGATPALNNQHLLTLYEHFESRRIESMFFMLSQRDMRVSGEENHYIHRK